MKVFLDNCLPPTLKAYLQQTHQIEHARDRDWVEEEFDVFITVDRAQRRQQEEQNKGYEQYQLAFVVLRVFSNRLEHLLPFVEEINESLRVIGIGEVHYISEQKLLRGV